MCFALQCINVYSLDTIGNCLRPLFSLGVSQHMHNITNLWRFELNRLSKQRDNNLKNTLATRSCVLSDAWFSRPQILNLRSRNQIHGIYFFLENYVMPISEGAVSYQLRFYANNCFEKLPIVSTAFNTSNTFNQL